MVVASRCFAFRALITQAQMWKSFRVQNSTSLLYLPIPSLAETWKIVTKKLIRRARWWLIAAIVFGLCSIYTAAVSINCPRYLRRMLRTLVVLSRKHFDSTHSPNFCVFYKHSVFPKKIVTLPLYLPITAAIPHRPLSSVPKVAICGEVRLFNIYPV